MSALGDRLRARAALAPVPEAPRPPPPTPSFDLTPSNPFRWGSGRPVQESADLRRVLSIPRRPGTITELITPEEVEALTNSLKRPNGTMKLKRLQAAALKEAALNGGLFGSLGVGSGKTIISMLLPLVMKSKNCVLMVPPALKAKLFDIDLPTLSEHWRLPNFHGSKYHFPDVDCTVYVVTYSQLSTAKSQDILDRLKPDLIVCDEAHSVKDPGATRTKRFLRFFRQHPETRLCVLSGTMTQRSIKDFAHLARFSLKANAPVPMAYPVLEEWAAALDAMDEDRRAEPGALAALCQAGEPVRVGYSRRLRETPGVVVSSAERPPTSLTLNEREVALPPTVEVALRTLRGEWVTPSGEELKDALSFSRAARQIASGLYLRWVWPESVSPELKEQWLRTRAAWHKELREAMKGEGTAGMDSPYLLEKAAAEGRWKPWSLKEWQEADAEFRRVSRLKEPPTEAVWIDDYLVKDAVAWGKQNQRGIIWYEHPAFGKAVAKMGGWEFFGEGTVAAKAIQEHKGNKVVVAGVRTQGEGKNLQMFNKQLVCTPSSNPKVWEQLLGRTHRYGQKADEVTCDVYLHTLEMRAALDKAVKATEYGEELENTEKKLGYCTFTFPVLQGLNMPLTTDVPLVTE